MRQVSPAAARGGGLCGAVGALACAGLLAGASAKTFTEEEVAAAVARLIGAGEQAGVYVLSDPVTGTSLRLVFDRIRVVRGLSEFGWFPDVIFHEETTPAKQYAVDFWLKPDGDRLKLMDVRIHKDPQPDGQSWMTITRTPLLWWWLPTLERSSAVVGKQAWQVMGAIHEHIVEAQKDDAYPLALADGKTVPTELVAIYQPVGRAREDGRYFACIELRKKGAPAASYAVDFWVDPDARSVTAGAARSFEHPPAGNGKAAAEPPCRLEGVAFDVVE
jgi:hypothetical protein